jgi:hypothetical protein
MDDRRSQSASQRRAAEVLRLLAGLLLALGVLSVRPGRAADRVPPARVATLAHGVNMTRWFSAPGRQPPDRYACYVSPTLLSELKSSGFTYIRIMVAPEAPQRPDGSSNREVPGILTSTDKSDVPSEDLPAFEALPFPVADADACADAGRPAHSPATQSQLQWYCRSQWTAARVRAEIQGVALWARQNGVVAANGEFGILNDRPTSTRLAYIRAVREACEAEGLGWALWGYDDGFGFAIPLDKTGPQPLDPAILAALGLGRHEVR